MTEQEQQKLFTRVTKKFPHWSPRKCSGYVHGVVDEGKHTRPEHHQVKLFGPKHSYAVGYVYGFIDARGEDVFADPWLTSMKERITAHSLDHKWWKDE